MKCNYVLLRMKRGERGEIHQCKRAVGTPAIHHTETAECKGGVRGPDRNCNGSHHKYNSQPPLQIKTKSLYKPLPNIVFMRFVILSHFSSFTIHFVTNMTSGHVVFRIPLSRYFPLSQQLKPSFLYVLQTVLKIFHSDHR